MFAKRIFENRKLTLIPMQIIDAYRRRIDEIFEFQLK